MPIFESYTRRKKQETQSGPDVYQYDDLPRNLRVQIRTIMDDAIGPYDVPGYSGNDISRRPNNNEGWEFIRQAVCREMGHETLANKDNPRDDCVQYLYNHSLNIDELFELIQFSFLVIDKWYRDLDKNKKKREYGITQDADGAIKELNFRFREAGVGYQYESGKIIRVDSQLIHAEVVKPALQLLSDPRFKGPQEEFLDAHAHYRAGDNKAAVTNANNAFESTLKTICDIRGLEYNKGARASDLIKVVKAGGLLPDYLDTSFDQLIATLQSGLPKVRNEAGGHGHGSKPKETPGYIAAYTLHLAAAKIVLLMAALRASE